jgi:hypothetical protein
MAIVNDPEKITPPPPPPPDKALGRTEREEMVDKVLDDTARALKSSLRATESRKKSLHLTYLL